MFLLVLACAPAASAGDGATEALELRLHAELAIQQERATGHAPLADAMRGMLPGLLTEYLASRDETIALDVMDSVFVREQVKLGEMMQDPGTAWALDVFAGPGTGHEYGLRTALAHLADFDGQRAGRALERVMEVYDRNVAKKLDQQERLQELHERLEEKHLEAKLLHAADRADGVLARAEAKADRAADKAAKAAEKAAEKVEKAAEKAEKDADKAAEKVEKDAEQAEPDVQEDAEKDEKKDGKGGKKD